MDVDDLLRELNDLPVKAKASTSRPAAASTTATRSEASKPSTSQPVVNVSHQRVTASPPAPAPAAAPSARPVSGRAAAGAKPSSFSSMMDDLDLHMITPQQPVKIHHTSSDQSLNGQHPPPGGRKSGLTRMKCAALFLGGTRYSRGLNGAAGGSKPVCCDALRCTKCDFKVVAAQDRQWSDSVDYLFLRNNYPDDHKLAAKQKRDPASCAYCCQCSWVSAADEVTRVDYGGELRWVCGGHDMV